MTASKGAQDTPNSRVDPAVLGPVAEAAHELPAPVACTWIRRGFNDHYLLEPPTGKYVLRLYLNHKYWISGADDFRFELELLRFLHQEGVAVAPPVPRRDGELLGTVDTPAGPRHYALFAFAEGALCGPLTAPQARTLGQTLARFHLVADAFRPSRPTYRRYDLDLRYLLDQPVELLEAFLRQQGRGGLGRYRPQPAELRQRVLALPRDGGRYGLIHGDPHRGNAAVAAAGEVTLIDFDHGGFGWRAYDVAVCCRNLPRAVQRAALAGYEEVRQLSAAERALLPTFSQLRSIWDWGDVLAMRAAWGPDEPLGASFADRVEEGLREMFEP